MSAQPEELEQIYRTRFAANQDYRRPGKQALVTPTLKHIRNPCGHDCRGQRLVMAFDPLPMELHRFVHTDDEWQEC